MRRAATEVPAGAEGAGSGRQARRRAIRAAQVRLEKQSPVLKEMLEAVGSVGYAEASVGVAAARAGLSRRALELRFEGKQDCYLAAYEGSVGEISVLLREATKEENAWLGQLRVGLDALLTFLDAEPPLARALLVELSFVGRPAKARWEEDLDRAAEFFDLARGEPGAVASPPRIAGRVIASGVYGMLRSRLARGTRGGLRELLPELVHFAVSPYFGSQVAAAEMQAARAQLDGPSPAGTVKLAQAASVGQSG